MRYNVIDPPRLDNILGNQYLVPSEEAYGSRHRRKLFTLIVTCNYINFENVILIICYGMVFVSFIFIFQGELRVWMRKAI